MKLLTLNGKYVRTPNGIVKAPNGSESGQPIEATSEEELTALDKPENAGKVVMLGDALYLITED